MNKNYLSGNLIVLLKKNKKKKLITERKNLLNCCLGEKWNINKYSEKL